MFTGDNLPIMRGMDTESVDLIYLDPPFNSKKQWTAPIGSKAAGAAFKDAWTLSDIDVADLGILAEERPKLANLINSIGDVNGSGDKSYLLMMASRLMEMQRILKPTGSIYLHCGPTMSCSLKLLMDSVFGNGYYRNELVWQRDAPGKGAKRVSRQWPRVHDTIFFYSKSDNFNFERQYTGLSEKQKQPYRYSDNDGRFYKAVQLGDYTQASINRLRANNLIHTSNTGKEYKKYYLDEAMATVGSIWIDVLGFGVRTASKERVGYPTQKPLKLLERIIKASSSEGDTVLDPFCGCATACLAAEALDRNWIGIDLSSKAIELVKQRFANELGLFNPNIIHRTDIPIRSDGVVRSKNIKHILYGKQEGNCNGCKSYFAFRHFEVDHIIPKASGGPDDYSNLQLLCGNCNRIKGKKPMGHLRTVLKERGIVYNE